MCFGVGLCGPAAAALVHLSQLSSNSRTVSGRQVQLMQVLEGSGSALALTRDGHERRVLASCDVADTAVAACFVCCCPRFTLAG